MQHTFYRNTGRLRITRLRKTLNLLQLADISRLTLDVLKHTWDRLNCALLSICLTKCLSNCLYVRPCTCPCRCVCQSVCLSARPPPRPRPPRPSSSSSSSFSSFLL